MDVQKIYHLMKKYGDVLYVIFIYVINVLMVNMIVKKLNYVNQ